MAPTFFADDDQFYTCTKALFSRLEQEDPGAADGILNARMVIRIRCAEPDVEFTVNGRQRPVHTTFGPSTLRPTLEIELAADALHQIMLGELSLRTALANGLLEVRGQVWKVMALADLFYGLQSLYPQVLRDQRLSPG
jgi:hypothetical protein